MAEIKEFKGMMYDTDIVGDMSAVIAPHCHADREEYIHEYYNAHPFNVVRLEYPQSPNNTDKYAVASDLLGKWIETGIMRIDSEPAMYIYEQEYVQKEKVKKIRGIICKVKIENDVVVPHEKTNSGLYNAFKSDRYNLMTSTSSVFGSVFSLYRDDDGKIAEILDIKKEPDMDFSDDFGVTHRLWRVCDAALIENLKVQFENKQLVIADGHVRYETAVSYRDKMKKEVVEYNGKEDFNYVMMSLVPVGIDTPEITAVHRIIKNRQRFDEAELIEKLGGKFRIEKNYIREYDCEKVEIQLLEHKSGRAIGLYTGKDYYYTLYPDEETKNAVSTDAELLHREVFANVMGINKENMIHYVDYADSIYAGEKAVREANANCVFYLNPISAGELYGYAECGICTPKRTNNFFPRNMMGLIMNKFE